MSSWVLARQSVVSWPVTDGWNGHVHGVGRDRPRDPRDHGQEHRPMQSGARRQVTGGCLSQMPTCPESLPRASRRSCATRASRARDVQVDRPPKPNERVPRSNEPSRRRAEHRPGLEDKDLGRLISEAQLVKVADYVASGVSGRRSASDGWKAGDHGGPWQWVLSLADRPRRSHELDAGGPGRDFRACPSGPWI